MAVDLVQLAWAMVASLALIAGVIVIIHFIYTFGGRKGPKDFFLLRVLLDKNNHASLSAFQFLCWTLLIAFLYLTLWFLHLLMKSTEPPGAIPVSLMALMGISVAIPLASQGIAAYKRTKPRAEDEVYNEPDYVSMLEEDGRPSLLRVQMFLWTIGALAVFSWQYFVSLNNAETIDALLELGLPVIDSTLLFLMGLSATGYLGNQAYSGSVEKTGEPKKMVEAKAAPPVASGKAQALAIREIIPRNAVLMDQVTILGSGFGTQPDTLMIGQEKVSQDHIPRWENTRIEFTLPVTTKPGKHPLRIIAGNSSVSEDFTASNPSWIQQGIDKIDADIISEIWIDDPTNKAYRLPPIGHFVTGKRYYFFFEFAVPPGTPSWGLTEFQASLFINGTIGGGPKSFMPGHLNGKNYGVFDYVFNTAGDYVVEIRGAMTKSMNVHVV
jgi:hypothetical protein